MRARHRAPLRICTQCCVEKNKDQFAATGDICYECKIQRRDARVARRKELNVKHTKAYYERNREYLLAYQRGRRYGYPVQKNEFQVA